jgi:predicted methyltransferase
LNENKITIIDPITGLNAAKSTFKIEQIQLAFNNAIMVINDIFFRNFNFIDDNEDEENNIIIKLFSTNNLNNYLY